jgi:hypothetical protein
MIPTNPAFAFTPLQEQLLDTALRHDEGTARRWAALRSEYSLDEITDRKPRRLLPLVEGGLRREKVTGDLVDRSVLQQAYDDAAREHEVRIAWFAPVVDMLRDEGVGLVTLKGLTLALAYYETPALRPMVDVDILIRPRDIDTTMRVLERAGWTPRAALPQDHVRRRREVDFRGPAGEKLDVHWHLHPAFMRPGNGMTNDEPFFARAVPLAIGATETLMLDPTDLFLHVIVHGASTGWRTHPLWAADAVTMIEHGAALDGERFVALTREANAALPVVRALEYVSRRFGLAPRFAGSVDPMRALTPLAHRMLFRQRRLYAQIAFGWKAPTWLQRVLGPFASTYHYWAIQTVTWPPRRAIEEFPGWLADTWHLEGPRELPRAAWARLVRPHTERAGSVDQ